VRTEAAYFWMLSAVVAKSSVAGLIFAIPFLAA
jgi:hypothetical protein